MRALFPLQISARCQFYFTTASVVTTAVLVTAALVSRVGRAFLGIMVVWNVAMGLFLTHDVREWPHRLQEVLPYCIYTCESSSRREPAHGIGSTSRAEKIGSTSRAEKQHLALLAEIMEHGGS